MLLNYLCRVTFSVADAETVKPPSRTFNASAVFQTHLDAHFTQETFMSFDVCVPSHEALLAKSG